MKTVVLDTGPLSMVTNPKASPENDACKAWLANLLRHQVRVIVPEIADYEVRRELLRAKKINGLIRLDVFISARGQNYLPLTTAVMRHAAELWAKARQEGKATASDASLDGDMILIAQAFSLGVPSDDLIVATKNVSDIARFIAANQWENIAP